MLQAWLGVVVNTCNPSTPEARAEFEAAFFGTTGMLCEPVLCSVGDGPQGLMHAGQELSFQVPAAPHHSPQLLLLRTEQYNYFELAAMASRKCCTCCLHLEIMISFLKKKVGVNDEVLSSLGGCKTVESKKYIKKVLMCKWGWPEGSAVKGACQHV